MIRGQDRGSTEYFPILTNSLPHGVLLELLLCERGVPFPPELSGVMDSMYWWGRIKNIKWYDDVIYMLAQALENDIENDRKELVRAMISVQVKAEINIYFAAESIRADLLWTNWIHWFNATYKDGPKTFHGMCLYCFEYVHWSIAQVNYHAHAPVPQTLSTPDAVDSA
jgi:hypothetical protein